MAEAKDGGKKASVPSRLAPVEARLATVTRVLRGVSLLASFPLALLGLVSLFGYATGNFTARAVVAVVLLVGVPLFIADRLLARMKGVSDRMGAVVDLCAAFWLVLAWVFVAAAPGVLVSEGDRLTRTNSVGLAKVVYALGGVSPTFRTEREVVPAASASASTSASAPKEAH